MDRLRAIDGGIKERYRKLSYTINGIIEDCVMVPDEYGDRNTWLNIKSRSGYNDVGIDVQATSPSVDGNVVELSANSFTDEGVINEDGHAKRVLELLQDHQGCKIKVIFQVEVER